MFIALLIIVKHLKESAKYFTVIFKSSKFYDYNNTVAIVAEYGSNLDNYKFIGVPIVSGLYGLESVRTLVFDLWTNWRN